MIDELVLVVSPKHRLAKSGSVSIKDLGNETFVAHNAAVAISAKGDRNLRKI